MCAARPAELTEDTLLKCHRPWLSGYDQTSEDIRGKGSCGTVFTDSVQGGNPSQGLPLLRSYCFWDSIFIYFLQLVAVNDALL